jgi:hypothetical protein
MFIFICPYLKMWAYHATPLLSICLFVCPLSILFATCPKPFKEFWWNFVQEWSQCAYCKESGVPSFLYACRKTGRIILWRCLCVHPSEVICSFPEVFFFWPSLELLHWNLVYCFAVKRNNSSLCFSVIDSFLQELHPLNFSVFLTFYSHLCSYRIETWFIVLYLNVPIHVLMLLIYFCQS